MPISVPREVFLALVVGGEGNNMGAVVPLRKRPRGAVLPKSGCWIISLKAG